MKKISNFSFSRTGIVSVIAVGIVIFFLSTIITANNKYKYKSVNSQLSISNISSTDNATVEGNGFLCEAKFELEKQLITDIHDFQFNIPINQLKSFNANLDQAFQHVFSLNNVNEISFTQHKVMVLPIMKMIHLVGDLSLGNNSKQAVFQLQYENNADQSVTIMGSQEINLSDFNLQIPAEFEKSMKKDITITINLKMMNERLLSNKPSLAAK